jgi:glutamate decarboxylase
MAGEWLTATANTNMFTYEIAPVFILMEHVVMEKMREIIGFQGGDSILAPGKTYNLKHIKQSNSHMSQGHRR